MQLSRAYELKQDYDKHVQAPPEYAVCVNCRLAWVDDIPILGPLKCPQPGCNSPLLRGVADPTKMDYKLDEEETNEAE